jgi:prepilin-type N-terminal cleavage/methylation domain-containing protein/prepilin-type processing-associated H-X9-DG protein
MSPEARQARRRGVTLVEILVVIAILATLLAVLLPALQGARESARKNDCGNKLRQIGLAIQGYEVGIGRLPPGVLASGRRTSGAANTFGYHGWTYFLHLLLPRLEESAYHGAIGGPTFFRETPAILGPLQNTTAFRAVNGLPIPVLLCPTDQQAPGVFLIPEGFPNVGSRLAKSNYLGFFSGLKAGDATVPITGTALVSSQLHPLPPRTNTTLPGWDKRAVFGYGTGTAAAQIKDGASNTMMVSEYLRGVAETDGRGFFWENDAGLQFLHATTGPNAATPDLLMRFRGNDPDWGCRSAAVMPNNRPDLNLPCQPGPGTGQQTGANDFAVPRSRHLGGVSVLFVDGHVQFIGDTVDSATTAPYGVWQRLAWIDDGGATVDGSY